MRREHGAQLARVVSVGRNAAWIAFEGDDVVRLAALRKNVERQQLVPGDLVLATPLDDERVVVERREPRTSSLTRTTSGGRARTMAANIDAVAIVAAFARPGLHLGMIDELIAFAELHDIAASVIFTKPDLAENPADVERIPAVYRSLGYTALVANPKTRTGIASIERTFADTKTLLVGKSGVGKSSLFAALGGPADVGAVSKTGEGKQTTTSGRVHRFARGFLIDSPGVGDFELEDVTPAQLQLGFVEFGRFGACRFGDCTHRAEPGCMIRRAVEDGRIASTRYASYRAIADRLGT